MANYSKNYKIKLNSIDKIEELLQEIYDSAHRSINEIELEMTKFSQSIILGTALADERSKYAKAMHDYITDKNRAISMKLDIAKFMGEVTKFNGNISKAVNETEKIETANSLNLDAIRLMIANSNDDEHKTEEYQLGKK